MVFSTNPQLGLFCNEDILFQDTGKKEKQVRYSQDECELGWKPGTGLCDWTEFCCLQSRFSGDMLMGFTGAIVLSKIHKSGRKLKT